MISVKLVVRPNGVYVDIGPVNVTLPLLLTNSELCSLPKKLIVNGRGTCPVEPSSFADSTLVLQPVSSTIAAAPAEVARAADESRARTAAASVATSRRGGIRIALLAVEGTRG